MKKIDEKKEKIRLMINKLSNTLAELDDKALRAEILEEDGWVAKKERANNYRKILKIKKKELENVEIYERVYSQKPKILSLLSQGKSRKSIADLLGVDYNLFCYVLRNKWNLGITKKIKPRRKNMKKATRKTRQFLTGRQRKNFSGVYEILSKHPGKELHSTEIQKELTRKAVEEGWLNLLYVRVAPQLNILVELSQNGNEFTRKFNGQIVKTEGSHYKFIEKEALPTEYQQRLPSAMQMSYSTSPIMERVSELEEEIKELRLDINKKLADIHGRLLMLTDK